MKMHYHFNFTTEKDNGTITKKHDACTSGDIKLCQTLNSHSSANNNISGLHR